MKRTAAEAAAAFAESLKKRAKGESIYGAGPTALTTTAPPTGAGPSEAKKRQALMVSKLTDSLSAFRRDRGTEEDAPTQRHTLKLELPEPEENGFERNWVAAFIGREGINKKRLKALTGADISLRGKGTQLRGKREDAEDPTYVLLEADTEEALDKARVQVLAIINPRDESSALVLFDEQQMTKAAVAQTTNREECAFCGKEGHHHSVCPKRKTKFTMSGVFCSACGSSGHTLRDCKGDRSNVVKLCNTGKAPRPDTLEDADYAAFLSELDRRAA